MIGADGFEFQLHWLPEAMAYGLYMFRRLPDGSREFQTQQGTIVRLKPAEASNRPLYLTLIADLSSLKSLVDEAESIGIYTDNTARAEGELNATKQHLFDMRAIVYKHEGLMFEPDKKDKPPLGKYRGKEVS